MTMKSRQRLIDQLILHEAERCRPYVDSVGKITIGVGRNLSDVGLSHAEVMMLLDHDLEECVQDLRVFPWFAGLDAVRQRVVIDMRFNLGPARFRLFKRMIRCLGEGAFQRAAVEMRESKWYGQVGTRGVRLVQMMQTGQDYLDL